MDLYLNESRGRIRFKALLGQANHLIVTALVGLDGVEKGLFTAPPQELHAAWSPQSPVNSARRARRFILDMALVRAVDSIDVYIRMARRLPGLIQEESLRNNIDGAGRSVLQKIAALEERYGFHDPVSFAMVRVMVAWRNKSAHEDADTIIETSHRKALHDNAEVIASDYRGLDVERLLDGFNSSEPTFKETASLISAAQRFVEMLERLLFHDLDAEKYLKELVWTTPAELSGDNAHRYRKRRLQSVWGRDISDRPAAVVRHLRDFGITDVRRHAAGALFPSLLVNKICQLTPTEIHSWSMSQN